MASFGNDPFDLDAIGAGLVVARSRIELDLAARSGTMVVIAPPGTGKTTFVPPLIANVVRDDGVTILTQPRRVAVRTAANRLAELSSCALGQQVGYTVRGERKVSANTRIEVVTPGVLLRRLLADPGLDGVAAVILDEVHERSLDSDLLLGMLTEVRALRDNLCVVAMSATLAAGPVAELLGGASGPASIVDIPSALYPLQVEYAPFSGARLDTRGVTREYLSYLAEVAAEQQAQTGSDALVFVPGVREVDAVVRALESRERRLKIDILPLHGRLSSAQQDRAVRGRTHPSDPPRIVVSTALAESSLTVPGVRLVIDSGLAREVRRDNARDMTGLVTISTSRSSADQRAGRAARQGPGKVVRIYSEADFARMPADSLPEIGSADLLDAALLLAAWGAPGARGLPLLTRPPEGSMERAERLLASLDLVNDQGLLTPQGTRISRLPIGVREARALVMGAAELKDVGAAAGIVAAFSDEYREAHADLPALLKTLRSGSTPQSRRWAREQQRLERLVNETSDTGRSNALITNTAGQNPGVPAENIGIVAALARPEWVARRVTENGRTYLLASGTRAALPEGSSLRGYEWIAVREVQRADGRVAEGTGAVIRLAAPISESDAVRIADALVHRSREARIDDGRVRVRERRGLGAILFADIPVAPRESDTGPAIAVHLREVGVHALRWTDSAQTLRGRLALLSREVGEPWPKMSDEALLHNLETWLGPDLRDLRPDASLHSIDVTGALRRLMPWPEAAKLDDLAPERLRLPSGGSARIEYPDSEEGAGIPVVAAKLQELFGFANTPRIAGGKVPILFHLLSPARKVLAVTADLESFWNGPYAEVRREMRGRYPKHPWPEDPWTAQATAYTKRRVSDQI
ncbi:MAG: ATP-dependent helicase HrpB [Leucobacter sp.]